jgi:hypothetical protein
LTPSARCRSRVRRTKFGKLVSESGQS